MPVVVLHSISGTSESLIVEGAEAPVMEKMEVTDAELKTQMEPRSGQMSEQKHAAAADCRLSTKP